MKVFVVPEGGNIFPWSKPSISVKFRIHADRVSWSKRDPLTAHTIVFGMKESSPDIVNHVDLDELRFFDRVPLIIVGNPRSN